MSIIAIIFFFIGVVTRQIILSKDAYWIIIALLLVSFVIESK